MKTSKRQLKLMRQYRVVILYMLNRDPNDSSWNEKLKEINSMIRKSK